MMDCKRALEQSEGNMEKAATLLRMQGQARADARMERAASEGMVAAYVHAGGRIGVLVEVNCETDFVARGEQFQAFVKDVCLQVCSASPRWVAPEDVSQSALEAEKKVYMKQAADTGKPEHICAKIAEGKLKKWYEEVCLLKQSSVRPEHDGKTIEELMTALSGKCGEKISVRRFVRFQLGEGIEKPVSDLAADVAAELAKAEAKVKAQE
jgi:elongation factor Ts